VAKQPNAASQDQQQADKTAASVKRVFGAFQSVASMSGNATSAVSAFGGQVASLTSSLGPAGTVAGAFVSVVSSLPQLFKSAADSVQNYVQAFSPLTAQRYSRAWADLTASIGQTLMPVLDAATSVVRFFGDTIAGLNGVIRPLVTGVISFLKPAFEAGGATFREMIKVGLIMFEVFKPVAGLLLQVFTGPFRLFVDLFGQFIKFVAVGTEALARFFGVNLPKFDGSSQGKAFANTSTTNTSSMLGSLREKAYQLGGGGKDVPQQQLDIMAMILKQIEKFSPEAIGKGIADEINRAMKEAVESIRKFAGDAIGMLPKAIAEATKGLPKEMADAIKQAITDAVKAIPGFGGGGGGGGGFGIPGTPFTPPMRF